MFKHYYKLTKPGMIYGNAITAAAGFFLASRGHVHGRLLLATIIGLSLVIASGCVFNNIYDRKIDAKMARTKRRELARGAIGVRPAFIYGCILITLGAIDLYFFANPACLIAALAGFVFYVFLYTPLKHRTAHAALVGAVAGATPPVIGYTAVTARFDLGALLLFLMLLFWQMPHFYAIAIRRLNDYIAAGVPVMPARYGLTSTKIQILLYTFAFLVAAILLKVYGFTGYVYLIMAMALGVIWLYKDFRGFKAADNAHWAKNMFLFSLITLTTLSVFIAFGNFLP